MKTCKYSPILIALSLASLSHGAVISWQTPVNISSNAATFEASVANTGVFVSARNFGSTSDVTINGVTFTGQGVAATTNVIGPAAFNNSAGVFSVTALGGSTGTTTSSYTGSLGAFAGTTGLLDANQQSLLRSFISGAGGTPQSYTVTLEGLIAGNEYQIQIWASDSRVGGTAPLTIANRQANLSDGTVGGATVLVDHNVSNTEGGLGQYVIGTFTANATNQSFTYTGATSNSGYVALSAYSVHQIPEPSAALLGVLGLSCLALRRR